MPEVPAELHYAAGVSAKTRKFHRDDDCERLWQADRVTSCPASHPPRGHLCDDCFPDESLDELSRDARQTAHAD